MDRLHIEACIAYLESIPNFIGFIDGNDIYCDEVDYEIDGRSVSEWIDIFEKELARRDKKGEPFCISEK